MTAALLVLAVVFAVFVWLVAWLVVPFVAQICSDAQAEMVRRQREAELLAAGKAVRR